MSDQPTTASQAFLQEFTNISGTGQFVSSGSASFFLPQLEIPGVGEIAFPLPESQAKQVIDLAESAPFGMGTRTVLDESVRKCWQLDAGRFSFKSPAWTKFLKKTVESIEKDLGINGQVEAVPYKLLIYGKGGHFKPHKDSEKLDAMFGSLIIALPSKHQGGRLCVRHDGAEEVVDFSETAQLHDFQYAAFFADCEHEVQPVKSGYRCCVAYNLCLKKGDPSILNLSLTKQASKLLEPLEKLKEERRGNLTAVLLEHSYTAANFALGRLKGEDYARSMALLAAAPSAGLTAHLALVTRYKIGALEDCYEDRYSRGRRKSKHRDSPMGEIYDESLTISNWLTPQDEPVALGKYEVTMDCLVSATPIDDGEPDEQEEEGYTGNEGCTLEYWYHRAAIVLWAQEDLENVICRQNIEGACTQLSQLIKESGTKEGSAYYRLGKAAVAQFHEGTTYSTNQLAALWLLMAALAKAKSRDLLQQLIGQLPAKAYTKAALPLWKQLLTKFGAETLDAIFQRLLVSDAEVAREPLFRILSLLADSKDGMRCDRFAARISGFSPLPPTVYAWERRQQPVSKEEKSEGEILLAASCHISQSAVRQAVANFLKGDGSIRHIHKVLAPALLAESASSHSSEPRSLAPELLQYAKEQLQAAIKVPISAYPDWQRPCPPLKDAQAARFRWSIRPSPKGDPLDELATFMADPAAQTYEFARIKEERQVLESVIAEKKLELDCSTLTRGTPHRLVCKKNSRSVDDKLQQREEDNALLKQLK